MHVDHFDQLDLKEWLRKRIWHRQLGWQQRCIGHALGVTEGGVSRWVARLAMKARLLCSRNSVAAPPRCSNRIRCVSSAILGHGVEAYGYRGEVVLLQLEMEK